MRMVFYEVLRKYIIYMLWGEIPAIYTVMGKQADGK